MIKPIRNKVLLKPMAMQDVTESGIIVPDSFKKRGCQAKIVDVGTGTKNKPMEFKAGQTCWHIKDAGLEIEDDGEMYVLIDDYDILGYTEN